MPDMPPDTPWWAWLVAVLGVAAISALSTWLVNRPTRDTLKQVARDAAASAEQTVNQHQDAEYPNLREELTAVRTSIEGVRDDIGGLHSETRDLRADVTGIRTDARRDRRQLAAQTKALDDHIADMDRLVREAEAQHILGCPARREKAGPPPTGV